MLFRDQYTIEYGNPFLLPSYANRGELSYNYRSFISTSVAYTYIQDAIIGYTVQNDSTKVTMSPIKNMKSSRRLEYSIFFQKTIMEKWDISIGGTLAYVGYKGDIDGVNFGRNGISYFGNISNSILISKNTKLEISGRYLGPNFYGVLQLKSRWLMSFAYKMSLCKDKLDVTLGVDDIFYTYIIRSSTNFGNQNWSYEQINDTRRFRVSINYKFGKMKIEKRNVNESNKEEKERFNH